MTGPWTPSGQSRAAKARCSSWVWIECGSDLADHVDEHKVSGDDRAPSARAPGSATMIGPGPSGATWYVRLTTVEPGSIVTLGGHPAPRAALRESAITRLVVGAT